MRSSLPSNRLQTGRQNYHFWAPCDPEMDVHCKEQGAKKVMCWAVVMHGKVLLHWFEEHVTGDIYLKMLHEVLLPQLGDTSGLWFQQDGAPPHMPARDWLLDTFGGRAISS